MGTIVDYSKTCGISIDDDPMRNAVNNVVEIWEDYSSVLLLLLRMNARMAKKPINQHNNEAWEKTRDEMAKMGRIAEIVGLDKSDTSPLTIPFGQMYAPHEQTIKTISYKLPFLLALETCRYIEDSQV